MIDEVAGSCGQQCDGDGAAGAARTDEQNPRALNNRAVIDLRLYKGRAILAVTVP